MSVKANSRRVAAPAIVRRRSLFMRLADAFTAVIILAAVIAFTSEVWSLVLCALGVVGAAVFMFLLAREISGPETASGDLDEYQFERLQRARKAGFTVAVIGLMFTTFSLWLLPVAEQVAPGGGEVAMAAARAAGCVGIAFLVRTIFAMTRLIAGEMNRDELVSRGGDA